jgi:hypothetical protein
MAAKTAKKLKFKFKNFIISAPKENASIQSAAHEYTCLPDDKLKRVQMNLCPLSALKLYLLSPSKAAINSAIAGISINSL